MKKTLTAITLAAVVAAGCGVSDDSDSASNTTQTENTNAQEENAMTTTITGELAYRERIALIPGGTATITLSDVSMQDVAAPVIAETTIELDDQQIPIPFELVAETTNLDPSAMFSLRATITGPGNDLQWTTDTANPIDIAQAEVDLGTVMLVQASATDTGSAESTASPLASEWNVTEIAGTEVSETAPATLVFGDDATLGGNTGCNSFSATYSVDGDSVSIDSEPAVTLMACDGDVAVQEATMLDVLASMRTDGATFEITDDSTVLTITTTDGTELIAQR